MDSQTTKYYSSRQESGIATALRWSVVSGSGARSFHPGDIISDEFLGECKTHMNVQTVIHIYINVWITIMSEAQSVFRKPVLFVDNGTQQLDNTWCVIPAKIIPTTIKIIDISPPGTKLVKVARTRISFQHTDMRSIFDAYCPPDDSTYGAIRIDLNGTSAWILPLHIFEHIFCAGGDL